MSDDAVLAVVSRIDRKIDKLFFNPNSSEKIVEEFEAAVREHAFKGAAYPEDHASIEKEYQKTKDALLKRLALVP